MVRSVIPQQRRESWPTRARNVLLSSIVLLAPFAQSTRSAEEALLLKGRIVNQRALFPGAKYTWRVTLDDGKQKHDAIADTEDGSGPSRRRYKFNMAAYELDKALDLNLTPPSVGRSVNGQPASFSWLVTDVAMNELDRRRKKIDPPDPENWNKQLQIVRIFDELIANAYRNIDPDFYLSTVWDNLLITRDWRIRIIDHTAAFRNEEKLEHPESLMRCERRLLDNLRKLNGGALKRRLGKYLDAAQLDALEARRKLIVKHFDELIARNGENAVLY